MVARRLTQPAGAPAPAPAAAPAPSGPAQAVLEPKAAPPPAAPASTALAPMSPALLAAFQQAGIVATEHTTTEFAGGNALPYLMFYDKRATTAEKVRTKFPHVGMGDPVLVAFGDFAEMRTASFTLLDEFQYWTENDGEGKPTGWRTDPPASKDWKENVLCLMLLLPKDMGPVLTLTGLRTTKCPIASRWKKELALSGTAEGVQAKPRYGAMAQANFPPRFRVVGAFRITPKAGKNPYALGESVCGPATDEQAIAIMNWFGSEEGQEELAALKAAFTEQVNEVKKKAAARR